MHHACPVWFLIAVQFGAAAGLVLHPSTLHPQPAWLALALAGLAFQVWALLTMRLQHLRVGPRPAPTARLLSHGPYRLVRHPMYTALLVATGALVGNHFTWWRAGFWLLLLVALILKARHEEDHLAAKFPDYPAYAARTKRFLPWIY